MSGRRNRSSLIGRASRWLVALAGAGLASTVPAAALGVPPSAAPTEWVLYAEGATAAITGLLEADSEPATRLRVYLHQTRPAEDQSSPPLVLKVWVDGEGMVSRIDFSPFAHEQPNADLRTLIVGRELRGPPPRDMLLPLRIAVQLAPPSERNRTGRTPAPCHDALRIPSVDSGEQPLFWSC